MNTRSSIILMDVKEENHALIYNANMIRYIRTVCDIHSLGYVWSRWARHLCWIVGWVSSEIIIHRLVGTSSHELINMTASPWIEQWPLFDPLFQSLQSSLFVNQNVKQGENHPQGVVVAVDYFNKFKAVWNIRICPEEDLTLDWLVEGAMLNFGCVYSWFHHVSTCNVSTWKT